jgi:ssDNA thymidine ADP-ribosyltransferase, DarT
VERGRVTELHYIASIDNLASIMSYSLLSHSAVAKINHSSGANESVQAQRKDKVIPGGRPLHIRRRHPHEPRGAAAEVPEQPDERDTTTNWGGQLQFGPRLGPRCVTAVG